MNTRESLFSFLDHSSSIYYIITDSGGVYTYANSLFRKIFGYLSHDISTKEFSSAIHVDDFSIYREAIEECLANNDKTVCVDLRHPRFDGSLFWTRWEFCAISEDGNTIGIQCIGNDISERKRAELEKLLAQENLQLLMNNTEESFMMIGKDLQVLSYNAAANDKIKQLYNLSLKKGFPILNLDSPERHEFLRKLFKDIFEGQEHETEVRFSIGGNDFIYSNHYKPAYSENKEIVAAVVTSRDITEKKIAEEKLISNERHFRALIENSAEGLAILSLDGMVLEMSPSGEKILGYFAHELPDIHNSGITHPEDAEKVKMLFEEVVSTPASLKKIEYRIKTSGNNYIWIACTYHNLLDEPSIRGIVLNFRDITEQKEADQALQVSEEQYRFLFHLNPQPMWIYDAETLQFLEVNEAAVQHYGYSAEEFHRMTIKDIQLPDDASGSAENGNHSEMPNDPAFSNFLRRHKKHNGEIIFVEIKSNQLEYNSHPARLVLANDVTEKVKAEEQLIKSNERFTYAVKASSDALWEWDLIADTVYIAEAYTGILGWKINPDRKFSEWYDYIHPDDREATIRSFQSALNDPSQDICEMDYRHLKATGDYAYIVDKAYIIRNEKGAPVRVVGSIRDTTERKEAEEKLARERYLLRTLIDHLPDYIYVKDRNFNHIINNKANVELMGAQSEKETLGKSVFDYFDRETAEQYIKHDRLVLQKGEPIYNLEEAIVTHGNKKRWLLTTKVPLKDDTDKVFGLVGISRDITVQKEIAESLRVSNERFNIVSKATNDAIWDWDLITGEILWNKAIKHLFGYKDAEIGKTSEWWYEKIHPEDKERVISKIHHHIDKGIEKWQDEYRFVKADGTYKFVLDRGFILLDNEQKPYRMIGAMMDITERRKLEAELAEQKINKQREITEATIQAQEKERSELGKELHDNINQILSTTKLYIDMALTETDIREELLQKTYRNISSAIEEIRMLSKSLVPPSLGDIGLKEAVTELIASLNISQRIKLSLKTVGMDMFNMPDNLKLMAYRIVQEQVNNIIKHSRATEAEIKLAVSKKMFNITVRDNGIGFDAKRKANGIGLSNITSRAELHNGKVDVVSSPGKGCTLKVSLPF
jgi:two-component system sensor histidine kinase UhpB